MATISELAPRVLRKLTVLSPGNDAEPEDNATAIEKLEAVHAFLKQEDLLRWTQMDIPDYAEEAYVSMAAFLAGPEFTKPVPIDLWVFGQRSIRSATQLQAVGRVATEYF